jgi:hypothetical protein
VDRILCSFLVTADCSMGRDASGSDPRAIRILEIIWKVIICLT